MATTSTSSLDGVSLGPDADKQLRGKLLSFAALLTRIHKLC